MKGQVLRFKQYVITDVRTRLTDTGTRVIVKPSITRIVELEIDIAGLFASIGQKAAENKTGISVIGSGLVTARRIN